MTTIPKIYRFGDRHTTGILEGRVVIEEKVDGSQFSFGLENGLLVCRSKNTVINQQDPGMFALAVGTATSLADQNKMVPGFIYQCEFLARPKHNVLTYARVPAGYLVLFDVISPTGLYLTPQWKGHAASVLGLEPVHVFHEGPWRPDCSVDQFLAAESQLGGCKVEGVVIKNYARPHAEREHHPLTAKVVSEAFKEVKKKDFAPGKSEVREAIERAVYPFRTTARWLKAVQHLREAGSLTETPKDIGLLLAEVWTDTLAEETDAIKDALFKVFQRELRVNLTKGFPEWYLSKLQNGFTVFETEEVLKAAQNPGGEANQ